MIEYHLNGDVSLHSATQMPKASSYLWNKHMMVQLNCRGFAVAQFLQPEPSKYARGPNIEATTFIQPEHPYYSHHPGRFFYIKDNDNQRFFSVPYEPVKKPCAHFQFTASQSEIRWVIHQQQLQIDLTLSIPADDVAELWQIQITDLSGNNRDLSLYSYFPAGYMSWMNQSAHFDGDLNGVVCQSIAPYQKVEQYFANKQNKDNTVLLTDAAVQAYETRQNIFEGEGGLHAPDGVIAPSLSNGTAKYETPTACMQFAIKLNAHQRHSQQFVFAPVANKSEAHQLKQRYLATHPADNGQAISGFDVAKAAYQDYLSQGKSCFQLRGPDREFDHFVHHWLPRQVFYHGDVNRLSTDPQTRNYLQDAMGMLYLQPEKTRQAFVTALSQQQRNGAMPDGILLHQHAELKYINQVPHTDHAVWVAICLKAYLDETNDYELLKQPLPFKDSDDRLTVFEHLTLAMQWLISQCDHRGLSYINQGDWCDPMNMVGYQGKGVSTWLSLASAYALQICSEIAMQCDKTELAGQLANSAQKFNHSVNQHCWDGQWYSRGITDDNQAFGIAADNEGRIFLNPQSFAILSGAADVAQQQLIHQQIEQQLHTPFGPMMLAPSYTQMREDVGRVTQKYPGTAENGSVYNHATMFYIFALLEQRQADKAWALLSAMIPGKDEQDLLTRGQLPTFIPNYYRGAYFQHPEVAGKSSHLFNTGTVAWFYRCVVEQLLGLKGTRDGLQILPNLPSHWQQLSARRQFRGASFSINYQRQMGITHTEIWLDGKLSPNHCIRDIKAGQLYRVDVRLPLSS